MAQKRPDLVLPVIDDDSERVKRTSLKDTKPKDSVGSRKVTLGLLSPIAKAHWAAAQHLGKVKYGAWNWRACGVRASVYLDAMDRHRDAYLSGERVDPVDGTHHLGNIMACCAILLEAEALGNLVDDRPPPLSLRAAYAEVEATMAATVERYKGLHPRHYTIADRLPAPASTRVDAPMRFSELAGVDGIHGRASESVVAGWTSDPRYTDCSGGIPDRSNEAEKGPPRTAPKKKRRPR